MLGKEKKKKPEEALLSISRLCSSSEQVHKQQGAVENLEGQQPQKTCTLRLPQPARGVHQAEGTEAG